MTKARPIIGIWTILVALAMISMSMPTGGIAEQPMAEGCCPEEGCSADSSDSSSSEPPASECCSSGCSHCFLPCCGSPVEFMKNLVIAPTGEDCSGMTASSFEAFDSGYRFKIYHPPGC